MLGVAGAQHRRYRTTREEGAKSGRDHELGSS